jgi:magnesium-transporting ATPase (P-type)
MKVSKFYADSKIVVNSRKNTILNCDLSQETLKRINEAILFNVEARIEMGDTKFIPVGDPTEVGLVKFLQNAGYPVHLIMDQKLSKIKAVSPFTPERKRSVIAIQNP